MGFAINNATQYLAPDVIRNLSSGSQWIKLATIDTTYNDIDAVKSAKKAKKQQKRDLLKMAATPPSPSFTTFIRDNPQTENRLQEPPSTSATSPWT